MMSLVHAADEHVEDDNLSSELEDSSYSNYLESKCSSIFFGMTCREAFGLTYYTWREYNKDGTQYIRDIGGLARVEFNMIDYDSKDSETNYKFGLYVGLFKYRNEHKEECLNVYVGGLFEAREVFYMAKFGDLEILTGTTAWFRTVETEFWMPLYIKTGIKLHYDDYYFRIGTLIPLGIIEYSNFRNLGYVKLTPKLVNTGYAEIGMPLSKRWQLSFQYDTWKWGESAHKVVGSTDWTIWQPPSENDLFSLRLEHKF